MRESGARGLLLGACMAAVLAYPTVTRAADGLQKFEALLPAIQAELKKDGGTDFSYAHGSAIGDAGFELDDVTINVPADKDKPDSKPSKATIKRVVVDDLDFNRIDAAHLDKPATGPYFAKLKLEGLVIDGGVQDQMKGLGVPDTSLDFALDYRYDEARKVLELNRLGIELTGLAALNLTMIMDGVPPPGPDSTKQAEDNSTLRTLTLTYRDHSLLKRALPIAATMTGMPVEQGVKMLQDMLAPMLKGQSDASIANADALISYVMDWQAPKGALEIKLTPPADTKFDQLKSIATPDDARKLLGLQITYSGTRAGVAMASATPGPSAGGAPAALCSANNRVFVRDKDDGTLSAGTVLESTAAGRCIVRLDGAAKGDDTVAGAEDLRRWSIDGPGDPLAACEKGKSVFALSDGTWTPAKVRSEAKGGKCEVKFKDQDDSEEVPLTSIRVAGD